MVLIQKHRNLIAQQMLKTFGAKVDEIRVIKRSTKGLSVDQELYHKYWLTVVESTDELNQRKQRLEIIRGLLSTLFKKKDADRVFSQEQRRMMTDNYFGPAVNYE